jgi:hypothetical protein
VDIQPLRLAALIGVAVLAGCAMAPPVVVRLTWIKVHGSPGEVQRNGTDCVIVTDDQAVGYAEFGALFRRCLGE